MALVAGIVGNRSHGTCLGESGGVAYAPVRRARLSPCARLRASALNLTGDGRKILADGMTEALTTDLAAWNFAGALALLDDAV